MIHFAFFCCKRFFNLNISQTIQARGLKFVVKDREVLEKIFEKMRKFRGSFATLGRITLELSVFQLP